MKRIFAVIELDDDGNLVIRTTKPASDLFELGEAFGQIPRREVHCGKDKYGEYSKRVEIQRGSGYMDEGKPYESSSRGSAQYFYKNVLWLVSGEELERPGE